MLFKLKGWDMLLGIACCEFSCSEVSCSFSSKARVIELAGNISGEADEQLLLGNVGCATNETDEQLLLGDVFCA